MGSIKNQSKSEISMTSDEDGKKSVASDSEPGNPVSAFDIEKREFIPYGFSLHKKPMEPIPVTQLTSARKKIDTLASRKKSVQFIQTQAQSSTKPTTELVAMTKRTDTQSEKTVSHFRVRRSSAIDREIQERQQLIKQESNNAMIQKIIDPIWAKSISQIINFREGANESYFAQMWSRLFFLIQTYNFFTAFFFIGIEGQPTGYWYLLEVICEILMIFDFVARWLIRVHFSQAWSQMYLLHDRGGVTNFHFYIRLIASVPYQIITSIAVSKNPKVRENIWIASLRLLKLLKFSQVVDYFNAIEFQKRQMKNYSINKTLFVSYYMLCFLHTQFCFIAWVSRVDPEGNCQTKKGWYYYVNFCDFPHNQYDLYRESFVLSIMGMMGLANGALWATTNLEYFALVVQFVSGASLLIGYFSWIVSEFAVRNIQIYENSSRYELAKQFCDIRLLPTEIRLKIRYYYHNMRIEFEQYNEKTKILQQLPIKIQTQIAPLFNSQVLKNIKFLQLAKPEFVSKIACKLMPEVSLNGDLVVKYNEIADKMYFVQDGSLEVLATDHFTTIAFLGAGAYFGEIGVLITGKRSLSIKALSNCMCYSVNSADFLQILDEYPEQTQFLRAVGYQRLQTTHPSDIKTPRDLTREFSREVISETSNPVQNADQDPPEKNYDNDISFLRLNSRPDSKRLQNDKIKTKFWLTKQFNNVDFFIIMPFSQFFYVWNVIMLISFTYVFFMVCYGIGFKEDHGFDPLLIVCQVIFAIDIPLRMRTGITRPSHISTNLQHIFTYYINTWLFYDMLASIPIEYVLQVYYPVISRWIMVLKFFKIFRLYESLQIYLQNTNLGHFHSMFAVYIYLVILLSHVLTCYMCYVCEWYPKESPRFDRQSLISKWNLFNWTDKDPINYDRFKKYMFYLYFGTAVTCNQNYADQRPYSEPEEYGAVFASVIGRVILAFTCTETAQYLGEIYKSQSRKLMSTRYLDQWMKKIRLPKLLISRIKVFNQMQFRFQHQIDETEILEGLPPTLQSNIKSHLFAPLIRTWEAISKENIGEVMSIVNELELVTFPENEFVVKIGEVANEMYFIVDGLCQVLSSDGTQIAVLKQGQNFGEMALLDPSLPMRMASVKTLTNVNLAILTREKFERISELYPQFKENINRMVKQRLKQFMDSKRQDPSDLNQQMIRRLQQSETVSQESSLTESLTDSDFDEEEAKLESNSKSKDISIEDQDHLELRLRETGGSQHHHTTARKQVNKNHQNEIIGTETDGPITTDRGLIRDTPQKLTVRKRPQIKKSTNKVLPYLAGDQTDRDPKRQLSWQTEKSRHTDKVSNQRSQKSKSSGLLRSATERLAINLSEHQVSLNDKQNAASTFQPILINVFKWLVQFVVHYNLWFIPINTAFKFPIQGVWLGLEIATIVVYSIELVYRSYMYIHLNKVLTKDETSLSIKDRKLKQDYDKLQGKIMVQKTEFILTLVAIIPLNLICDRKGWYQSVALDALIMSLRLVKLRPLGKVFKRLHKINLPLFRLLEVIYYNYLFCNFYSVILIDMSIWQPDARKTWIRRLPINPSMIDQVRKDADWRTNLSPLSIYINALWYIQGTFSHVANGDITMTNAKEWLFNSCLMISSTFIYFYLFANIASIVSNLTSETHLAFLKRRNLILSKVKNSHMPLSVVDEVNLYFDYQFYKYNGLSEQQMIEKLPDRIKLDIKLSQYSQIIEQSLLFRKVNGEFDPQLANSFLSTLKTQIYLSENYITKVGQIFEDSFLILEGVVNVVSFNNNENLGILKPGDFYATDISARSNTQLDRNFFQYTQGESLPKVNIMQKDNFEGRSMVHLISKTFVVIGLLQRTDTQFLYKAFPQLKKVFRHVNRYMFDLGRKQVEKHIQDQDHQQPTRDACLKLIRDQITLGTPDFYDEVMRKQRTASMYDQKNLSYILKNYYIVQLPLAQRKVLHKTLFSKNRQDFIIEAEKVGATCCCEDAYIEEHGRLKRAIRYIHFFNLVYTSLALPFYVAFNIRIRGAVLCVELVSSLISLMVFLLNFRTPYIENGEKTLNFIKIAREYLQNGMIVDFFGMLPLNIVLDFMIDQIAKERTILTCCLVGLFRCTRMFSIMQAITIFEEIKVDFKKVGFAVYVAGNALFCFLIGHWIVCLLTFLILVVEQHDPDNWWQFTKLGQDPTWSAYMHLWYAVINITTGAGVGDIIPTTDVERVFFTFMINSGDVIFALVFGLINNMVLSSRLDDETGNFIDSMVRTERCLAKFEISSTWKDRIEQFYTYQQKIKASSLDLNATDLLQHLPESLVKKILYYQYGHLVRPFCKDYYSENLIRDICFCLKSKLCMPEDIIMSRGEIGTHIYFILEGKAQVLGPDNKKIVANLEPGSFIGDLATLSGTKRNVSVVAKTFVLIKEISLEELNQVLATYPDVHSEMKKRAINGYQQQRIKLRTPSVFTNELRSDVMQMNGVADTSDGESSSSNQSLDLETERKPLNVLNNDRLHLKSKRGRSDASLSSSVTSSFEKNDSVKVINQDLENLADLKKVELGKQAPKTRRFTIVDNIDRSLMLDHNLKQGERIKQQTDRQDRRDVGKPEEANSAVVNQEESKVQITNRSRATVTRRLSGVSIGKSLSIRHQNNIVNISVNQ